MSTLAPPPTVVRDEPLDASPPPRQQQNEVPRLGSQVLFAFALLVSWMLLYLTVLSGFEQSHDQHGLYDELRAQLAEGTAPTGAPIAAGAPVALLSIPALGVENVVVVEGTRSDQTQQGPGHALGTVLPGQQGTSVVTGRSLTFGATFRELPDLGNGDTVRVTTAQGEFTFKVTGARRAGDPVPSPVAEGGSRLTLATAAGEGRLAGLRPSETYYVDAELLGKSVAAGARSTADPHGLGMKAEVSPGQLALLALALQLLLLVLAGAVWAWHRWSRIGAWVTGLPAVLAVLWLVSSLVSGLLPAMI
ncbi:sortase domain-containing protein [Marmoricola sp. RAF53]|uniref:sortase domain-containing protein n=1 Tax=Marmoricola sp. RAF53 TaxID=3233059 RepID=UPI003F9613BA